MKKNDCKGCAARDEIIQKLANEVDRLNALVDDDGNAIAAINAAIALLRRRDEGE